MADPIALCPICSKPLADLPAVLRQGDEYVHAICWTGEEPIKRATMEADGSTER